MKCVVLLIVVSFSQILANPYAAYRVVTVEKDSNINRDLEDFIKLFPVKEISSIVQDYVHNDEEVKNNWNYIQSSDVQQQIKRIEKSQKFQDVLSRLDDFHIDYGRLMLHLQQLVGHIPRQGPVSRAGQGLRGLLLGSIKPLIPVSQMKLLATQKFIFSSEFRRLTRELTSKGFKEVVMILVTSREVKELENSARVNHVDVDALYEFVASFYFLYEYLIDM